MFWEYVTWINIYTEDDRILMLVVVALFSWLGITMTVMDTLSVSINKLSSERKMHYNFKEGK